MHKNRYMILMLIFILVFAGCGKRPIFNSQNSQTISSGVVGSTVNPGEAAGSGNSSGQEQELEIGSKFIVLSSGLKGEGQGTIAKLVPYVVEGIKMALQQGGFTAKQDLVRDGALRITDQGLSLMFFLKPSSLIAYSDEPLYVKGGRDAGFLWSCVQTKLASGIGNGNFTPEEKIQLQKLVHNFHISYFNTQGQEINITMPGNTPIILMNSEEINESNEMQNKVAQFFSAKFD